MNILISSIIKLVSYFSDGNLPDIYIVDIIVLNEKFHGIKPVYITENGRYIYDENNNMII